MSDPAPEVITDHYPVVLLSGPWRLRRCDACGLPNLRHWDYAASLAQRLGGAAEDYLRPGAA